MTEQATGTPQRPGLLSALCILSFISSGLWMLLGIGIMVAGPTVMGMFMGEMESQMDAAGGSLSSAEAAQMEEGLGAAAGMGTAMFIIIGLIVFLLYLVQFLGVKKMWNLKKSGFTMYAVVNGLFLVGAIISFNIIGIIIIGAFIALYASQRKVMS